MEIVPDDPSRLPPSRCPCVGVPHYPLRGFCDESDRGRHRLRGALPRSERRGPPPVRGRARLGRAPGRRWTSGPAARGRSVPAQGREPLRRRHAHPLRLAHLFEHAAQGRQHPGAARARGGARHPGQIQHAGVRRRHRHRAPPLWTQPQPLGHRCHRRRIERWGRCRSGPGAWCPSPMVRTWAAPFASRPPAAGSSTSSTPWA